MSNTNQNNAPYKTDLPLLPPAAVGVLLATMPYMETHAIVMASVVLNSS